MQKTLVSSKLEEIGTTQLSLASELEHALSQIPSDDFVGRIMLKIKINDLTTSAHSFLNSALHMRDIENDAN